MELLITITEIFRIRSHDESGADIREKEVNLSTSNYFFAVHWWWLRWIFLLDQCYLSNRFSINPSNIYRSFPLIIVLRTRLKIERRVIIYYEWLLSFDIFFVNEFDLLILILNTIVFQINFITKVLSFPIFNYYIIDIHLLFIF